MEFKRQLGKNAHVSMKSQYLEQCNDSIRYAKRTIADKKKEVNSLNKAIDSYAIELRKFEQMRKEILNLK